MGDRLRSRRRYGFSGDRRTVHPARSHPCRNRQRDVPAPGTAGRLAALGTDLDISKLDMISGEIGLAEVIPMAGKLMDGQVRGRVVVDVNA